MPVRNDTTSFAGNTSRDRPAKSNALGRGFAAIWGLLACLVACDDSPRVRTIDPGEPLDAAVDMAVDHAVDAAPDATTDMAPEACVARVAAVDLDGEPGAYTACPIAPPNGCDQLAACVCGVLAPDEIDDCTHALTFPRALINLSDECRGQARLDAVCQREVWHMSAPAKFALDCSPACADVPATLAER